MSTNPEVGIVGHGTVLVHRDGHRQAKVLREGLRFRAKTVEGAPLLRRRGAFLGTGRMTIRSSVLHGLGPFQNE